MGEEVSFQLITRHVRPDFAGLLATLRKRVSSKEEKKGAGGRLNTRKNAKRQK